MEIEAKCRLADEYDAAQRRGEVAASGQHRAVPNGNSSSFNSSGTTEVWGGTHKNDVPSVDVATAYTQFTAMYNYWTGAVTSGTAPTTTNLGQLTSGATNVFYLNGNWALGAVTFSCSGVCSSATQVVVVVNGTFTSNANISLGTSGLTDDQVLYVIKNATNSALTLSSTTTATIQGDFLVNGGYTIGTSSRTATLDGRVFAGLAAGSQNLVWNGASNLDNEPDAPEPATWGLMIGGLGGCLWLHRRRRKKQAPNSQA